MFKSKDLSRISITHETLNKVPQITIIFWIIKLLTTGMGEVAADFFSSLGRQPMQMPSAGMGQIRAGSAANMAGPPSGGGGMDQSMLLVMAIVGVVLIITMVIQISSSRYVPWKYWLNVSVIAIFGTLAADAVKLGFIASTSIYMALLAIILITWFVVERTLSVHNITTLRRELFYWATVLASFAMGTALGDLTAMNFNLGNLVSGFMFVGLFAIPAIAYKAFHVNEVFCFWFAYILTRPLGASFADWMANDRSGLGWGKGYVSLALTAIIITLVAYISIKQHKDKKNIDNNRNSLYCSKTADILTD